MENRNKFRSILIVSGYVHPLLWEGGGLDVVYGGNILYFSTRRLTKSSEYDTNCIVFISIILPH